MIALLWHSSSVGEDVPFKWREELFCPVFDVGDDDDVNTFPEIFQGKRRKEKMCVFRIKNSGEKEEREEKSSHRGNRMEENERDLSSFPSSQMVS